MKNRASSGSGPSQRQLRVGELVRHALSDILARGDLPDPALTKVLITVPEVRMSPDLKIATCFVMPLGGKDTKAAIDALATNAKPLRGAIGRRVELKFVPELRFRIDTSFEEGSRIDALLRSPVVQRDLETDTTDSETDE
ncbi:30S ribosome-binding factor RbfA [Ancylobacter sp. WKF20]|uniref:30S ribosome-binding factor RbfA n=1 Tax=Ancylobacter sp. WKF20 TaxID=3039801 RepID=UPI00243451D1|nr:30S ribosome-binding factor RbfA [Ancylobacter sp. WKF20]WGD29357.1 30S ribosome-binding factor RbfA [Ancylobacter sp. WKF20]